MCVKKSEGPHANNTQYVSSWNKRNMSSRLGRGTVNTKSLNNRTRYVRKIQLGICCRFRDENLVQPVKIGGKISCKFENNKPFLIIGNKISKRMDWPISVVEENITKRDKIHNFF